MKSNCIVASVGLLLTGMSFGQDIVHDASVDLVVNQALVNPCTNAYGGVWSYCYASSWDGGERIPMAIHVTDYGADIRGFSRYKGTGPEVDYGVPYIMVEATGLSGLRKESIASGVVVDSGELIMHPGKNTDSVLRFEVPRAATYSGEFSFRAVAQLSGTVKCILIVNGRMIGELSLDHTTRGSDASKGSLTLPTTTLSRGDTIEIALNRGTVDFYSDGVAARIGIVESDPEGTWADANAEFPSFIARTNRTETWSVYTSPNATSPSLYMMHPVPTAKNIVATTNGLWLAGVGYTGGYEGAYPYVLCNTNDTFVLARDSAAFLDLCPGELLMHPDNYNVPCVRFAPRAPGVYTVRVQARDVSKNLEGKGVNVSVVWGGRVLAKTYVSVETRPASGYLEVRDLALLSGEPVGVVVDSAGIFYGDATAVRLTFEKTSSSLPEGGMSLQEAFAANMTAATPTNPFVDAHGITWTLGKRDGRIGDLTVATRTKSYGPALLKGWDCNEYRPFFAVNMTGGVLEARDIRVQSNPEGEGQVYPGEVVLHPGNGETYAVVRAAVPVDGVYDIHSLFRHQNVQLDGIDVALIVRQAAYGAVISQICNVSGKQSERAAGVPSVYLKAGETIEAAVGSGPGRYYSYDLASMQLLLQPVAGEQRYVSVDFRAADSQNAPMAGAGRIGWTSDAKWNVLNVSNGDSAVACARLREGKTKVRTAVEVSVRASEAQTLSVRTAGAGAASLQGDGVVSTGSDCIRHFTVSGLVPNREYTLYLYSRDAQGGQGLFTVGTASATSNQTWFNAAGGDYAELHATADENGVITGTFASAAADKSAVFTGLQIAGREFQPGEPSGLILIYR